MASLVKSAGCWILGLALALAIHALCFQSWPRFHGGIDFNAAPFEDFMGPYYKQALAMHVDQKLQPGFLYPPAFAIFLKPLGVLSGWAASWTWLGLLGLASLLLGVIGLGLGRGAWASSIPASPVAAGLFGLLFGLSFPWVHDMHWGQVSTIVWALTLGGLWAWERQRRWTSACLLALAISLKLFPAWFLLVFAMRKDWGGIARVAGLSIVGLFLAPGIVMGPAAVSAFYGDLMHWWSGSMRELFWESETSQFVPAVLHRLWGGPVGLLQFLAWGLPLGLAAWTIWRAWNCVRAKQSRRAWVLLAAALPLVLSPSWPHYFVWLPWALWWAWQQAALPVYRVVIGLSAILMSTPFFLAVGGHPFYPASGFLALAVLGLVLADALRGPLPMPLREAQEKGPPTGR